MHLVQPSVPSNDQLVAIRALVAERARADGRDPLSDQALTQLTSTGVQHVLAVADDDTVVGYAQRDGDSLEIVAGADAAGALLGSFEGQPVLVWSHGQHSPLLDGLRASGFRAARELHQLRRPLTGPVDVPPLADGIEIHPFAVGMDEDAVLRVNAAAFAHHPEQGSWTRVDLAARQAESWFDPSGFLLAWRGTELLGFHWTKVHDDGAGEVYVLGVDPAAQGLGLGKALLNRGLAWLREHGCTEVLLYVDGDNTAAMALYERAGFTRHDLDVQWAAGA